MNETLPAVSTKEDIDRNHLDLDRALLQVGMERTDLIVMRLGKILALGPMTAVLLGACGPAREAAAGPPTTSVSSSTWQAKKAPCVDPGENGTCTLDSDRRRPYDVYVPANYEADAPLPVVIGIHGGGGNSTAAAETTCPEGDRTDPSCLHSIGMREGFVTVYPNGTSNGLLKNVRTWNAGGGGDWNCASGIACQDGIDDIAYFNALLDDLESWVHVDTSRVYATGLSNGAAMSHRVGCELSSRITAIAPVGGTNQFSTTADCDFERPVPVLQIHGTADPCWTYDESAEACIGDDGKPKMGVKKSTEEWAARNGCELEPVETLVPDTVDDGTTTTKLSWTGCEGGADVTLLRIEGGGHTWPGGDQYLRPALIGPVAQDWDSTVVWGFFQRFAMSGRRHPDGS
jgi:polyhydroxybutyrate depolymerase